MEKILMLRGLTSISAIEMIKQFESFRAKKYRCAAGHLTIGYGHKLTAKDDIETVSLSQATELLYRDILLIEKAVLRNIIVPLNNNQFDALVSFTFNVGRGALQRSTLRQKINRYQFELVESELLRWTHIKGVKVSGLIKRRKAEVQLFYS